MRTQTQEKQGGPPILKKVGLAASFGLLAGASVSPFIGIVDRAIVENISGKNSLVRSLKRSTYNLAKNPFRFVSTKKEVRWVLFVTGNTYAAANVTDTVCQNYGVPVETPKLFVVSAVNIFTTLCKDRALARMFGTKAPQALPLSTFSLWIFRDVMVILSAFIVPPIISKHLVNQGFDESKSRVFSQFFSPLLLQVFITPVHMLGFDIYNSPYKTLSKRMPMLKREYFKTVFARMLRMTPAYGIGGVLNLKLMEHLRNRQIAE